MENWRSYQRDVAEFFRSLGLEAQTDVTLVGVRTDHDVDVVARGSSVGLPILWIIECKQWAKKVPKEKVLALRAIVDDVGADRGFMMAESGYQKGALEAAQFASVTLTSIADLTELLEHHLGSSLLHGLLVRADHCRNVYWEMDIEERVARKLKTEYDPRPNADIRLKAVEVAARQGLLHGYPLIWDPIHAALISGCGGKLPAEQAGFSPVTSHRELADLLDPEVRGIEDAIREPMGVLRSTVGPIRVDIPKPNLFTID